MNFNLLNIKNVESYFMGYKVRNNTLTEDPCLVVGVSKKEKKEVLDENDLIPSSIDGIKTDVIEVPKMYAFGCSGPNSLISPSRSQPYGCKDNVYDANQQPFECVSGGASIGVKESFSAGTLGFVAVDSDGSLVAVTNNHVAGNEVYEPKTQPPINYIVSSHAEDVYVFYNTKTEQTFINPSFNGTDAPIFEAGRVYNLIAGTNTSEFPLFVSGFSSVEIIKDNKVIHKNGEELNNSGRKECYIKTGEVMTLSFNQEEGKIFEKPFYGSLNQKNRVNYINILFFGTPYCFSSDQKHNYQTNYVNAELSLNHANTTGLQLVSPSEIDANSPFGSGQKSFGEVKRSAPLFFSHDYNKKPHNIGVSPSNLVDAAILKINNSLNISPNFIGLNSINYHIGEAKPNAQVLKTGRTTGVTQNSKIISTSWYGYVHYCPSYYRDADGSIKLTASTQHAALFNDCIYYYGEGEWFSDAGDSGSPILMVNADNSKSLVGLHFAGFTQSKRDADGKIKIQSHGLACKASHVFSELGLSPWDGSHKIAQKLLSEDGDIHICGKKYIPLKK